MKSLPPSPRAVEEGADQVTTFPAGQAGVQEGPGEAVVQRAGPGTVLTLFFLTRIFASNNNFDWPLGPCT